MSKKSWSKSSFTRQRFFYRKVSNKSWSKRFLYSSKTPSKVLLQKIIEEILIKNELLLHSESISFQIWGEKNIISFDNNFLTLINFLHLQTKTIVFCAKYWQIFTYRICIWWKSPYFSKKDNIYLKKSIFELLQPIYESFQVNRILPTLGYY